MIDFHTWATPNGFKVAIMLEEVELAYRVHPVDITAGEQFAEDYRLINPNSKIPTIVDNDPGLPHPIGVFESGAILLYLAEKTGRLLPTDLEGRYRVIPWLMWQMGGLGPMLGQSSHFRRAAPEKIPYAIDRYQKESNRLLAVLDRQLAESDFVAGDYSIADIAIYPWSLSPSYQNMPVDDHSNVARWQALMAERPAVKRGMALLADRHR